MISITCLKKVSCQDVFDINRLNKELDPESEEAAYEFLQTLVAKPHVFQIVARDEDLNTDKAGPIVGKATLYIEELDNTKRKGIVEQVVVDPSYRGKRIADLIEAEWCRVAKDHGALWIDLTSNPSRIAANKFYLRRGYARRDTNAYRKML